MKLNFKKSLFLSASILFVFSSCSGTVCKDPYKGSYREYNTASEWKVKAIPDNYFKDNIIPLKNDTIELISDYTRYTTYNFDLGYTSSFFTSRDLLVFSVQCCSSDELEFCDILEKEGALSPLFYRKKTGIDRPVTDDVIATLYCVEVLKEYRFKAGEIIYRFQ